MDVGANQGPPVLGDAEKRLYQAILRAFPQFGGPPGPAWLRARAGTLGLEAGAALGALAARGLVICDGATGALIAVHPFSGVPTPHRVAVTGAQPVYAMCAVDALGIPAMLGRNAVVESRDSLSGVPVRVKVRDGAAHWDPPGAVIVYCERRGVGPTANPCCGAINFFESAASAAAYLRARPEIAGRVVSQAEAIEIGRRQFGGLLAEGGPVGCCCL